MRWFGDAYGAPYEADTPHAPTPVGDPCAWCDEAIQEGDSGLLVPMFGTGPSVERAYHYDCHLRGIVGGVNHLLGNCACCGGTEMPDPPDMSRREAARRAVLTWRRLDAERWANNIEARAKTRRP